MAATLTALNPVSNIFQSFSGDLAVGRGQLGTSAFLSFSAGTYGPADLWTDVPSKPSRYFIDASNVTTTPLVYTLPDVDTYDTTNTKAADGHVITIFNMGTTNPIQLKNSGGTTIALVQPNGGFLEVVSQSAATNAWHITDRDASSSTTLQDAYDNSSEPEIKINSTLGAVTIINDNARGAQEILMLYGNDGAGAQSTNILSAMNTNAGTNRPAITGLGNGVFPATAANKSMALGPNAQANVVEGLAFGSNAGAAGVSSLAIGSNSGAKANSVALGGSASELQGAISTQTSSVAIGVQARTAGGNAQNQSIVTVADVATSLSAKYWTVATPLLQFYVWYYIASVPSIDPGTVPANYADTRGKTGIQVTITSGDSDVDVATATVTALNATNVLSASNSGGTSATIVISQFFGGAVLANAVDATVVPSQSGFDFTAAPSPAGTSLSGAVAVGSNAQGSAASVVAVGQDSSASAANATAVGYTAGASAANATAVGYQASASASGGSALGTGALAQDTNATAVGSGANASAAGSLAAGYNSASSGSGAVAVGEAASSSATDAVAAGKSSVASAAEAVALGKSATASTGPYNSALGAGSAATNATGGATAVGAYSSATGANAIAIGADSGATTASAANATGDNAIAVGHDSLAGTTDSIAIGSAATASTASDALAIGHSASATGTDTIVVGHSAAATAADAIAIGHSASTAGNTNSVAIGLNAASTATNSTAVGNAATADDAAVALGKSASAGAANAVAAGNTANASGSATVAVGNATVSSGSSSVAVGDAAAASANNAVALGPNTVASSSATVAVGPNAAASANNAIAVGSGSTASGSEAIALGVTATSSGSASAAIGFNTNATANSAVAIGSYITNAQSGAMVLNDGNAITAAATNRLLKHFTNGEQLVAGNTLPGNASSSTSLRYLQIGGQTVTANNSATTIFTLPTITNTHQGVKFCVVGTVTSAGTGGSPTAVAGDGFYMEVISKARNLAGTATVLNPYVIYMNDKSPVTATLSVSGTNILLQIKIGDATNQVLGTGGSPSVTFNTTAMLSEFTYV